MKNLKNKTLVRLTISVLLTISILSGCSSGNPTTPNKQTLTNLSKQPQSTTENIVKEISLSGRVFDSITRKPIEKASILIYVISNENIVKAVKEGGKVLPTANKDVFSSPKALESSTPTASVSSKPETTSKSVTPEDITAPTPPSATEEEEVISKDKKTVVTKTSPAPKTNKDMSIKSTSDKTKASTNPTVEKTTEEDKASKTDEKNSKVEGILDLDITSALTQLKINDIKEFKTTTSNDGKFWVNKVPDSSVVISVSAPKYRTVSVFSLDTSKVEDILLTPLDTDEYYTDVKGSIFSVNDKPIDNALVSSSYVIGNEDLGVPSTSNGIGEFELNGVNVGERTFVASVKGSSGKIISMGFLNHKIEKLKDDKKNSKDKKYYPVINLKAVTKYVDFKGVLDLPESTKLKTINVYVTFKKKDVSKEEVFFTEEIIEKQKGSFELSLPELEKGYSYNFEFVGMDKSGFYSYYYLDNVNKENKEIKVNFMSAPFKGDVNFVNFDDSSLPVFSWVPVEGANFYKVVLDRVDVNDNVVTIWEGITPFSTAIYPITTGLMLDKTKVKSYNWYVSAIAESSSKTALDKLQFAKHNILSWIHLSNSPVMNFSLDAVEEDEIIEIDPNKVD